MQSSTRSAIVFFLLVYLPFLAGCGSASTLVTKPNDGRYKSAYILVEHQDAKVNTSTDSLTYFENTLKDNLYFEDNAFYKGPGLTLSYQFIRFEEGDRFKRFVTAGISDNAEGNLIIETTFLTPKGKEVGKIETHAYIRGGLLGGSVKEALEKAAKEIAEYAKLSFK